MRIRGRLDARHERWPIAGSFVIAHGAKTAADVVVATLTLDGHVGRGEATPYPRFGESVRGVLDEIARAADAVAAGVTHDDLCDLLGPGAARCAIDCAMWDLAAQLRGEPVHVLAGLSPPRPVVTALTISVGTPSVMAARAREHSDRAVLKVKLDGSARDQERLSAVHDAAPAARLIVDPNGSWSAQLYRTLAPRLPDYGAALLEQPFGAEDALLASAPRPVAVAADEACRGRESIAGLADRYDVINVKLEKAGGLTEAQRWTSEARAHGMGVMIGCHVCTSLTLAPALLLATDADFVDLDAGLLLERDRDDGADYRGSEVCFPEKLWGTPR
jgi:L-alanine-DL-glutamate epimerase-like enolase superfamily enzyme